MRITASKGMRMGGGSAAVYAVLAALVTVAVTMVSAAGVAQAMEVTGTDDRDILEGTMNADLIKAKAGIDSLYGLSGPDTYHGGEGSDYLSEYEGSVERPEGDGFTGNDVLFGGDGTDILQGARGNDKLYGGPNTPGPLLSNELLFGDSGDDTLKGGDGRDSLEGEQGSDRMLGGKGPDYIHAADEETAGTPDVVDCGPGNDTAKANRNDTVTNCEDLTRVANPSPTGALDATATAAGAESGSER